jgi:hypothetical protein
MSAETPARPSLDLTVHAQLDGWPVDIAFTLPAERLSAALTRLGELGYTPRATTPPAPAQAPRKAPRERVEPVYKPDGTPCCPVHLKPLANGKYGLYCPSKATEGQEQNEKGYCALRFED